MALIYLNRVITFFFIQKLKSLTLCVEKEKFSLLALYQPVVALYSFTILLVFSIDSTQAQNSTELRIERLTSHMQDLEKQTQAVEDQNQITRIQRAFGFYLDKGYFGEAADLFTDNGEFIYGVDGIYRGKEHIRDLLTLHGGGRLNAGPGLPFGRLNLRMQLQPVVTVSDDGLNAQARWHEWSLLGQYEDHAQWGDALMENDYVKENGVWKIQTLRYYRHFVAPYQGGWAALAEANDNWQTDIARTLPPDAPSPLQYRPFPSRYTPPYHYANNLLAVTSSPSVSPQKRPKDELGKLETAVDEKQLQLDRQRSLRAVENLQNVYGYFIDQGRWHDAAALFTSDGTWEFGQSGVYIGPASIERGLTLMGPEGLEIGQLNTYLMLQPVIHVSEDNTRAWGRFRSDVMLSRQGNGRWGGGIYENEYINEDGVWKISKQHYFVTFWGDYDLGWTGDGIIPMESTSTSIPPDAPPTVVYESFPNTYIVPFHFDNPVSGRKHDDLERAAANPDDSKGKLDKIGRQLSLTEQKNPITLNPEHPQLQERLFALGRRIERLEDLSEVEILQRTYGYYVDKSLWYSLTDLWTEKGTLEIGGRGIFTGKERVFEYMRVGLGSVGPRSNLLVDHQQFQSLVTISDDGLTAEARSIAYVMSSGGWGHCYYENDYVKEDGKWKFSKLHGPFNMYSGYKLGWEDDVILNTFPEKFPPPPDLPPSVVYLAYPSYYAEPFHYPNPVTGKNMPPPDPAAGGMAFGRD
jgi:hypothetical protein